MRVFAYVFTRVHVIIFGALAAYFCFHNGGSLPASIMLGLFGLSILRIVTRPGLGTKLGLRAEKLRHGVKRKLSGREKEEIAALDRYTRELREAGVSSELLREPVAQAWRLVTASGLNDAAEQLRVFRQSLPALRSGAGEAETAAQVQERLRREVATINAVERELEKLGAP